MTLTGQWQDVYTRNVNRTSSVRCHVVVIPTGTSNQMTFGGDATGAAADTPGADELRTRLVVTYHGQPAATPVGVVNRKRGAHGYITPQIAHISGRGDVTLQLKGAPDSTVHVGGCTWVY